MLSAKTGEISGVNVSCSPGTIWSLQMNVAATVPLSPFDSPAVDNSLD